jgi:hypothetical protein
VFIFDTPLDPVANVDKIIEFEEDDSIFLSSAIFRKLPVGQLSWNNFAEYGNAQDADDYIVFDDDDKLIYYDPDGSGATGKIVFAKITRHWTDAGDRVSASDFYVV